MSWKPTAADMEDQKFFLQSEGIPLNHDLDTSPAHPYDLSSSESSWSSREVPLRSLEAP